MEIKKVSSTSEKPFAFLFFGLSLFLGILMPLLSRHYAISWDEWTESNYGRIVLKYILSCGVNSSFSGALNTYLYSAFFSSLTGLINGLFFDPFSHFLSDGFFLTDRFFAFFQLTHLMNSLFGFYLFFFTGLCAKEIRGWRTACLALVLTAISPRIFGHSMNNHEDIPFAAMYALTLFAMIRFFKSMPRPSFKNYVSLAVTIGLTIGSRIGGVILIFYLFVFGIAFYAYKGREQKTALFSWKWFGRLVVVSLYGYCLGLLFWPYGQINPFLNLFQALHEIAAFPFASGELLFRGRFFPALDLPRSYPLVWIGISTPLVVLAGWALFIFLIRKFRSEVSLKYLAFLEFAAFFPLAFVILRHSVLYNDWRHLYFIYGPLVILAALGWDFLFDFLRTSKTRLAAGCVFAVLISLPVSWMSRNHPYQALYFNEIEGGLRGAAGRYEIDYWGTTLRTAAEWLADYHLKNFPEKPAHVRAEGYPMSTYAVLREKLGSRYFPYLYPDGHLQSWEYRYMNIHYSAPSLDFPDWDYGISFLHQQSLLDFKNGVWPPKNVLFEIKVDGVPVCVVTKNPRSSLFAEKPAA